MTKRKPRNLSLLKFKKMESKRLVSTIAQNMDWIKAECAISFERDKAAKADYEEAKALAETADRQRHISILKEKVLRCLELNLAPLTGKTPVKFVSFTLNYDDIKAREDDVLENMCSELYDECGFLIVALRIQDWYYSDGSKRLVTLEFAVYC